MPENIQRNFLYKIIEPLQTQTGGLPLPFSTARLQKTLPKVAHILGQDDFVQHGGDLIQFQRADILCPAVRQYLLDILAALKGIRQVNLIGTPDNVRGRAQGGQLPFYVFCLFRG